MFEIRERVKNICIFILATLFICTILNIFISNIFLEVGSFLVIFALVLILKSRVEKGLTDFEVEFEKFSIREKERETEVEDLKKKLEILEKQVKEFKILRRISMALTSTINLEKVLKIIAGGIKENFSLKEVKVFIRDKGEETLVSLDREKIFLNEESEIVRCFKEDKPFIWGEREFVGIPLEAKGEVVGVIVGKGENLRDEIIRDMLIYTLQAGLAIRNAQNYEIEKNFRKVLEKEVEIATKKLKEAQEELVKKERLSAMGEMAAIVAHEVRNPIAFIRLVSEKIIKYLNLNPKDRKYINLLIDEIDKITKMTENMLIFARPTPADIKEVKIKDVIDSTIMIARKNLSGKSIEIEKEVDGDLKAYADEEQLRQVLLNLIQNSIYFLEESAQKNKRIKIFTRRKRNEIIITEEDNGPGVPEENRNKIFEPFFTTRSKGTGLGLSICLRLIRGMGGDIKYVYKAKGARFDIILPATDKGGREL